MPSYDDIAAQMRVAQGTPASPPNPYDDVVGQMRDDTAQTAARATLNVGLQANQNPEQAAVHQALARRYNTTPDVVAAYPQEFKDRMAMELARSSLQDAPQLQQRLAGQPQTAAIVHDDLPNAAGVERALTVGKVADYVFSKGDGATLLGDLGQSLRAANTTVAPVFAKTFQAIGGVGAGVDALAGTNLQDKPFAAAQWFDEYAQRYPLDQRAGFVGKMAQALGSTAGLIMEAIATGGESTPLRAGAGLAEAGAHLLGHGVRAMMVPSALASEQTAREVMARGGSAGDAVKAGVASYLTNTLQGVIPFGTPGGVLFRLGTGAAMGPLVGEVSRQVMNAASPEDMQQPSPSLEDMTIQAATGALFGSMAGPRSPVMDLARDVAQSHQAEADFQRLSTLGQLSASSKWRERDPDGFRDFVRAVTEDGQLANVYIDAHAFAQAMDRAGVPMEQVQSRMPDLAAQIPEASMTQGQLRIPTEDYAANIAGTSLDAHLLPDLKADPAGKSYAEAKAFYQEQTQRMQDTARDLVKSQQDESAFAQSQARVQDQLQQRLDTLGRFQPDVNRVYAAVQTAMLSRLATHEGITPEEAAARYAPAIVGVDDGSPGAMQQDGPKGWGSVDTTAPDSPDTLKPGAGSKGFFSPGSNAIGLTKNANLSTYLHETGHWALDVYSRIAATADAPPEIRADMDKVLKWFGVESLEKWHGMDVEEQRPLHERFARGFEAYLMEGKAPSQELAPFFQRIRAWMVNIYKSLVNLQGRGFGDVGLSAEVRGVFDRMLATDQAIQEAQAARVFEPLFSSKPAGMSAEDWAAYQDLGTQATNDAVQAMQDKSLRDMKWLSGAKSKAVSELQKQAKTARDAVTREAEEEVGQMPVYRMEEFLKRSGKMSEADRDAQKDWGNRRAAAAERAADAVKAEYLNRPEADGLKGIKKGQYLAKVKREMANEAERRALEWERENPKPRATKPSVDPELLAEMFGFPSGEEAMRALADAQPRKEVVQGLTDRYMIERHGELSSPDAIEQAASAAVHNDARARFVATGLKVLTGSPIPARELLRGAKEAAESAIGSRRIRDLSVRQHEAAETKANRDALKLVAKDPHGAAEAQRASLLNNQLVKATQTALGDIGKGLDYFAKLQKESVREKIQVEFRDQIDQLLGRYDLRRSLTPEQAAEKNMMSLEAFVEKLAAMKFAVDVPESLILNANRVHFKDMSVEEFRGLVDAVKSLDHLGREVQKVQDGAQSRMLAEVAAEAVAQTEKLPKRTSETNRGLSRIEEKWLGFKSKLRSFEASLLKMEQMIDWLDDYNPNGVFNRLVFRKIADAEGRRNDLDLRIAKRWEKAVAKLPAEVLKNARRTYTVDGVLDTKTGQPQRLTWNEKMALAGIRGDAEHFSKLLRGEKWDAQAVLTFLDRNMTPHEWEFVRSIADTFQELFPLKQQMLRELGGTAPKEVARIAFQTPHGDQPGWYWPITYDPARSHTIKELHAKHESSLFEDNIFTRADTSTGREQTRNENFAKPMLLSIDVLPRVLKDEVRDITTRRAIIEADRFLSHPDVRRTVEQTLSPEHYDQFNGWLLSMANDAAVRPSELQVWDRLAHGLRTRTTMVGLGFRISTMVMHGSTAALESVAEAGPKAMAKGMLDAKTWAGLVKTLGPEWMDRGLANFSRSGSWDHNANFITERSPEMRHRMNEIERDVREQLREIEIKLSNPALGAVQRAKLVIESRAYQGIAMLDMASAMPTWMGGYLKAMTPAEKGGLGMGEQDAVYFADKTVRNAHGGGGVKDMAAVQRGAEFWKLFTMFYTFWNHNINRIIDTGKRVKELPRTFSQAQDSGDWAGFRGDVGTLVLRSFAYTLGVQAIHHMMHPPKEEDGQEGWLKWFAKEMSLSAFGGVPIFRDVVGHWAGGKDYELSPIAGMVKNGERLLADFKDGAAGERWIKHALTDAGYVFGLPLGQPASSVQFLADVWNGKQHPDDMADWWHGITSGDMHPH
jgi:hypothetical protein